MLSRFLVKITRRNKGYEGVLCRKNIAKCSLFSCVHIIAKKYCKKMKKTVDIYSERV